MNFNIQRSTPVVDLDELLTKLRLSSGEFNALYVESDEEGYTGADVERRLRQDFDLPVDGAATLADDLEDAGIITADEAEWMRED